MDNILVSGATGFIGSALVPFLTSAGYSVTRLTHSKPRPGEKAITWQPLDGVLDAASLEGFDAVIHLAGENIATGRWTAEKKALIRDSRVKGTRLLCETLAKLSRPPRVLANASAVGYYGSHGNETLTEESDPGTGFLAEVCRDWEQATEPAAEKGIRVARMRFGVVLSPDGGALGKMLLPFKLGTAGILGDGRQYMSWIARDDLVAAILHVLMTESLRGPVNLVAPQAVTNREFTKTLGHVLWRPTILPMPAFAARLLFGAEMADEMLLAGQRVVPTRLQATHFQFRFPTLEDALRQMLGKKKKAA